jgi:hypothetical protein
MNVRIRNWTNGFEPFSCRLADLYAAMDQVYRKTAEHYGFLCHGCTDNCCFTHFHHHTFIEYMFIRQGYLDLSPMIQDEIMRRAKRDAGRIPYGDAERGCPVNFDGRCILYPYRPMICRLHGIPHELHPPGRPAIFGSGCEFFELFRREQNMIRLDRTPFYTEMAKLENEFKKGSGIDRKIKMTVAEMALAINRFPQTDS